MELHITMRVDQALARARKALLDELRSFRQGGRLGSHIARQVGAVDAKQNDQAFASQGAKSGSKWGALTKPYAEWKRRVKPNRKILTFSGSMRDSLRHQSGRGHINRMIGTTLEFGTSHRLAPFHQTGTRKMIARPPVRKSTVQVKNLKLAIAREMFLGLAARCGDAPIARQLRVAAGSVHVSAVA